MEKTMRRSLVLSCGILALISTCNPTNVLAQESKGQELPHGAAMSLGELQENMHVGASLPVTPQSIHDANSRRRRNRLDPVGDP
jgi:hypothetical protein